MVNGIESNRYIQKGKGSDRPFGHIKKNIIKEGTFSRMVFSISLLEDSHKASLRSVFVAGQLLPFQVSLR